ncbi:putative integral membrane protein [Babesia bovis T2Bo]|uniref:Membrane protein, putative n=1 Tax=Babesia bovis TaxID=5865 RepID=A7AUJ2_BABBO|nr:putative integral membrane protein [Babesia bovis T2Bo]EDO06603.1 putative integral membrane protein [Babesia bovis T2Bo]|eukprot:XP_001610171.1 membrane protein [Babesia bovis T2Bo]
MTAYALLCGIYMLLHSVVADRNSGHSSVGLRSHHAGPSTPVAGVHPTPHGKLRTVNATDNHLPSQRTWDLMALIQETAESESRWRLIVHIVNSILCIIGSLCLLFLSMQQAGRLFSQGMWSRKFLRGGGYWVLGGAGCGIVLGVSLGFTLNSYYIPYFFSGFMLLGASIIYIGRRGAILGTVGGLMVGLTLGVIHSGSASAIIVEGILCMLAGVTIGFIPIFPNLKMNSRYIDQGLRAAAQSAG